MTKMMEFLSEMQNAKNIFPFRPEVAQGTAAIRLAQYVDERDGKIWDLYATLRGTLAFRRGTFEPGVPASAINWEDGTTGLTTE